MKKYLINVHYDLCMSIYVDANDEDEAMNKAEDIADLFVDTIEINDDKRIDESTLYFSNSCLVDEEEIDNEQNNWYSNEYLLFNK